MKKYLFYILIFYTFSANSQILQLDNSFILDCIKSNKALVQKSIKMQYEITDSAESYVFKALNDAEIKHSTDKEIMLMQLSYLNYLRGYYHSAIETGKHAIELLNQNNHNTGSLFIHLVIAISYKNMNNNAYALNYLKRAVNFDDESASQFNKSIIYYIVATIYSEVRLYDLAIKFYEEVIHKSEHNKDIYNKALIEITKLRIKQNKFGDVDIYLNKLKNNFENNNNKELYYNFLLNKAKLYAHNRNANKLDSTIQDIVGKEYLINEETIELLDILLDKKYDKYDKLIELFLKNNLKVNNTDIEIQKLILLTKYYLQINKKDSAKKYIQELLKQNLNLNSIETQLQYYHILIQYYEKNNNYKLSSYYFHKKDSIKDLFNLSIEEKQIELLKSLNSVEDFNNNNKYKNESNNLNVIIISILIAILVLLGSIYFQSIIHLLKNKNKGKNYSRQNIELIIEKLYNKKLELEKSYNELKNKLETNKIGNIEFNGVIFSQIIKNIPISVIATDKNANILFVNGYFEEITGYSKKEVLGKNPRILKPNNKNSSIYNELWTTLTQKKIWKGELMNVNKEGNYFWELCFIAPILNDNNEIEQYHGIKINITHLKDKIKGLNESNEELRSINEVKNKVFSIISHDLRSYIGNIQSISGIFNEELNDRADIEILKEYGRLMQQIASNTFNLLENLLSWTKKDRNLLAFEPEVLDLDLIINHNIELVYSLGRSKNISIQYFPNEEIEIYADEQMMNTIIRNLLTNSIKFSEDNIITIKSGVYKDNKSFAYVEVADKGVGMDQKTIQDLYDPHYHKVIYGTKNEKGSGIGMRLCIDFIKQNGGELFIKSEINKGSTFVFTVPLT